MTHAIKHPTVSIPAAKSGLTHLFLRFAKTVDRKLVYPFRLMADRRFDAKFRVNTSGIIETDSLGVTTNTLPEANHYEPTPVPIVELMLANLKVDHSRYVFVDYGSGKGRTLLLASLYPFKSIIGVEFSELLHNIAQHNIETWKIREIKCRNIHSVCQDACEFDLPAEPLAIFFFTPFTGTVANRVIGNIHQSTQKHPRPIRVMYYGGNEDFLNSLHKLNFEHKDIEAKRPFTSLHRRYKGHLFSHDI